MSKRLCELNGISMIMNGKYKSVVHFLHILSAKCYKGCGFVNVTFVGGG